MQGALWFSKPSSPPLGCESLKMGLRHTEGPGLRLARSCCGVGRLHAAAVALWGPVLGLIPAVASNCKEVHTPTPGSCVARPAAGSPSIPDTRTQTHEHHVP